MVEIRRFIPGEEETLSKLLRRTLMEVNANYCPAAEMDWLYNRYTPEGVAEIAAQGHMYVVVEDGTTVGTGTTITTICLTVTGGAIKINITSNSTISFNHSRN